MSAYYLKTTLLLVITVLIKQSSQQKNDPEFMKTYNQYVQACAKEIGLDESYVNKVWDENHFPNDDKLKCYFKCMNLKLGVIDQAGNVNVDTLKKVAGQFTDAKTDDEIGVECGAIKGPNLCETAFTLMACVKSAELD